MGPVELNSVRMVRTPLYVPKHFWRYKGLKTSADKFADALNAAGFSVIIDPTSDYWLGWVDASVNDAVRMTNRAFPNTTDAATFAYLAWCVHVDDAVQAALRLGGENAALALLTSAWVDAQDLR